MKIQKLIRIISIILVGVFTFSVLLMAQNKPDDKPAAGGKEADKIATPSETRNQGERPEDSYLAKFHAQDIVEKLLKRNLEQIYLINVIQLNFKDKNWKTDYDTVYKGYKEAVTVYYQRKIIDARVMLEENQKAIGDVLRKIAESYQKDTEKLLGDCSEKILKLHLKAENRSNSDKNNELNLNKMRLSIAYGQLDDGKNAFDDHNYETAIYHYRVSKSYAIRILENIDILPSQNAEDIKKGQEKIKETYKVDKADNLNRIFDPKDIEKDEPKKP